MANAFPSLIGGEVAGVAAAALTEAELPPVLPISTPTGQSATMSRWGSSGSPARPAGPHDATNPPIGVHEPSALICRCVASRNVSTNRSQGAVISASLISKVLSSVQLMTIVRSFTLAGHHPQARRGRRLRCPRNGAGFVGRDIGKANARRI